MRGARQLLARHWFGAGVVFTLVLVFACLAVGARRIGWQPLWATPDQRGAWLMQRGRFADAAAAFDNPVWKGIAQMRGGQFADAAQSFSQSDTPEAAYDRGNALVMLGQYAAAITEYDRALAARPGWADAAANRALAEARAARVAHQPGQEADPEEKQRDEVYRRDRDRSEHAANPDTQPSAMSDEAIRALWLRRVQTRPADFLRARFAFQLQAAEQP
jgi:Ca-activated chloride channel family protein